MIWENLPLPDWFWKHQDARLCRVPVFAAPDVGQVPFYIRMEAREYHEALREARQRLGRKHGYFGVTSIEW